MNQRTPPLESPRGRISATKPRKVAVYGEKESELARSAEPLAVADTWASNKKADPTWNRLNRVIRQVRARGLEPPRPFGHKNLNLARLPIPPRPH